MTTQHIIKTFARRVARSLRPMQSKLINEDLKKIEVLSDTNIQNLCYGWNQKVLEIGFGNGEFTAQYAIANPYSLIIGAEPFLNGVASLMDRIVKNDITNIRIFRDDVRILLSSMEKRFLDTIFIICPDPWPKARHNKRRLVQTAFLDELAQYIKENGKIVIATDHKDYSQWIAEHISACKNLKLRSTKLPEDWIYTKYQRRGIDMGDSISYFELELV